MTLNREQLLAPCGIDCGLCQRHNKSKHPCPGCRGDDALKLPSCLSCKIKNCPQLQAGKFTYCSECSQFPCQLIKNLDKRYQASYKISTIQQLHRAKTVGITQFVKEQDQS